MEVEPRKPTEVAKAPASLDRVVYVALTIEDAELAIQVHAIDIQDLRKLITEKVHAIPDVWKTKTFVIMQVIKQSCDWQFPARLP